jgi:hypothetical protein
MAINVGVSELKISPMTPFGRGGSHLIAERFLSYRAPVAFSFPGLASTCVVGPGGICIFLPKFPCA